MPRPHARVVITGIGVISPIGIGAKAFWENLLAGKVGVRRIQQFDLRVNTYEPIVKIQRDDDEGFRITSHPAGTARQAKGPSQRENAQNAQRGERQRSGRQPVAPQKAPPARRDRQAQREVGDEDDPDGRRHPLAKGGQAARELRQQQHQPYAAQHQHGHLKPALDAQHHAPPLAFQRRRARPSIRSRHGPSLLLVPASPAAWTTCSGWTAIAARCACSRTC